MPQYGLVPVPQPTDPMQSLSGLMQMGRQMQAMRQASEEAPLRKADLESQTAERDAQTAERNATTAAKTQAVTDQSTIDHILQQGGDQDSIVEQLRSSGNGRLIPQVQKTFDEARTRKATFDKLVADTNKANIDTEEAQQKLAEKHADYLGGIAASVASHGYAPGAFYQGIALAHRDKMIDSVTAGRTIATAMQNPDQIKPMVDAGIAASPEQRKLVEERAKPATTLQGAILRARDAGDVAAVNSLVALQGQLRAAGRSGEVGASADTIGAVLKNPSIWGDITPSLRDKLLVPLSRGGFDFATAGNSLTETQKAQVERWRADQISDLNKAKRDPQVQMSDGDYASEKARIEESYRVQLGGKPAAPPTAPTLPDGATRGMVAPSTPQEPAKAPAAPAKVPAGDKTVTQAELATIAARKGTTVEQEKSRAIASGYVVR